MKSTSAMYTLSFRYRIGMVIAVILLVAGRPVYGQITGNNNVCINNTYSYSGPSASTYSWSVNGGGTITSSSTTQWIQIKWTQAGTWTIYLSTSTSSGGGGSPPGRPGPGGEQGYVDEAAMPFANTMLSTYTYTVTVNNNVTAGSIGGTQWVCSGGNPTTLTSVTGATGGGSVSYQWQKSTSGASSGFSNINGATGASYDPPGGLTQTTWYRRRAHSSLNCGPDVYSNAVKVSVYALPTAGSIGLSGNSTVCYNTDPGSFYNNVSPTGGGQHNYQWQKSTTSATSGFSNISGATSLSYNPGKLTQTTWFRRRVQTPCGTKYSNVIKITVYGQLKAGSISQPAAICAGATPAAINNVTSASGGTSGSYQWYRSTTSATSGFSAINGATGASYQPPALTVPTWYRRTYSSGAGCGSTSVTVKVTVNPLPAQPAAISVSTNSCGNKTLTRGTPPSDITWYWQGTNANGYSTANSSATYTASSNGTYYLRAYDNNTECWSASSSSVSVTVNPYAKSPTNPVITDNAACGPKTIDATGFDGATVYWQTSPSGTSTAHPSPYAVPTSGTYYARSVSAAGCWSQLQVPISVTVNTIPTTYTLSYSGDLCDLPFITGYGAVFTLSGSQQGVNYQLYLDGQPKDSVRSGTGAALVWNDIWDAGTYTVTATNPTTNCSASMTGSPVLTIHPLPTVEAGPDLAMFAGSTVALPDGSPAGGWWGGSSYVSNNSFDAAAAPPGTYKLYYNYSDNNSCQSYDTLHLRVTEVPAITVADQGGRTVPEAVLLSVPAIEQATYQWLRNGQPLAGATQRHLLADQSGSYSVRVSLPLNEYTTAATAISLSPQAAVSGPLAVTDSSATIALQLVNYTGAIQYWQVATADTGYTDTSATGPAYSYSQPTADVHFRVALLQNGFTVFTPWKTVYWRPAADSTLVSRQYVRIETVSAPLADTALLASTSRGVSTSWQYYDGLGRQHQAVLQGASPGEHDIVSFVRYDSLGRSRRSYLPFTATGGPYYADALARQAAFYNGGAPQVAATAYPYSEVRQAATPYRQLLEQGAPGADWQPGSGHTVRYHKTFNQASTVRRWRADGSFAGYYAAGTLVVSTVTDENGHRVRTYVDSRGRQVLKQVEVAAGQWLDTYSVYDDLGRLRYTLPPRASELLGTAAIGTVAAADELLYSYRYDSKGRLVEKQTPGAGVQYIVYDRYERPVLTQDANQRPHGRWSFVKYDLRGRVAYSGVYSTTADTTRQQMQARLEAQPYGPAYEVRQANSATHGYSNRVYPRANTEVLAVSYYDDYDFDRDGTADYSYTPGLLSGQQAAAYQRTRGMTTGSATRVLGQELWLVRALFYDAYGRAIQTRSSNHLLAGQAADLTTLVYDDDLGTVVRSRTTLHSAPGDSLTLTSAYSYDHRGRLLAETLQINEQPPVQLAAYQYNELGRLTGKRLHASADGRYAQYIDYAYNIRGWLTAINNPDSLDNGRLYGQQLYYQQALGGLGHTPLYNGNITAVRWGRADSARVRAWAYRYDGAERLLAAAYGEGAGYTTHTGRYAVSDISYDANGNILSLTRQGLDTAGVATTIDRLAYSYQGNQLMAVADSASATLGFADGATTASEYGYDANGNQVRDDNKGITAISYNLLNKPDTITFADGRQVVYSYSASGARLSRSLYRADTLAERHDYLGALVLYNDTVALVRHGHGQVVRQPGTLRPWQWQYNLTDHQGNTRTVFAARQRLDTLLATMETAFGIDRLEEARFMRLDSTRHLDALYDHTDGGAVFNYSAALLGEAGPGTMVRVQPGDTVDMQVYARYAPGGSKGADLAAGSLVSALSSGFAALGAGEAALLQQAFGAPAVVGLLGAPESGSTNVPNASLEYILFDDRMNYVLSGFVAVSSAAAGAFEELNLSRVFNTSGYLYIYVNNSSTGKYVYFDDMRVIHHSYRLAEPLQTNNYYPYGLGLGDAYTASATVASSYLYNGGSELNAITGRYETAFRDYDPALGRMTGIDIMAGKYSSQTPYNYAFNNPVNLNDPSGADPYSGISRYQADWGQGTIMDYGPLQRPGTNMQYMAGRADLWGGGPSVYIQWEFTLNIVKANSDPDPLTFEEMVQIAWDNTPEDGSSVSKFKNGQLISITTNTTKEGLQEVAQSIVEYYVRFGGWTKTKIARDYAAQQYAKYQQYIALVQNLTFDYSHTGSLASLGAGPQPWPGLGSLPPSLKKLMELDLWGGGIEFSKYMPVASVLLGIDGDFFIGTGTEGTIGVGIVWQGKDAGTFFVIIDGTDKGPISAGYDISAGVESMNIYYSGNPDEFKLKYLNGNRVEFSLSFSKEIDVGVTGFFSKANDDKGGYLFGIGVNFGVGWSPALFGVLPIGFNINYGSSEVIWKY